MSPPTRNGTEYRRTIGRRHEKSDSGNRHYIGDHGVGHGQMLTFGGLFFWAFVDIFVIRSATAERNTVIMNDIRAVITSARTD